MSTLSYKLFRDLKNTLGQVLAIAFVIAGGAATFIMSLSTLDSLQATRHLYYQQYNFADIFASVKRAPENVGRRIAEIPGVSALQTRVVAPVKLAISGFDDPVKGQIISVPDSDEPRLNKLYLRQGRQLDPNRSDEVLMNEAIAKAHNFSLGDSIQAVIKGRLKTLTIVGIVLSPETIYQLAPGAIVPDFKRYGVLWMSRRFLEASFEMEGAFNDVVVSLSAGASADDVIDRINLMLAPYGGIDAYGREWQTSHRFLNEEFKQLKQMSTIFSSIFLGVAAFLLNVVIKRLIDTQREQIAVLKAFGYRNREVAFHYIAYVLCIVSIGLCLGAGAGIWLGK
ncbi:MAG: putative ABC transport system permease protein, partial [Cellvibrionaceae bacterium]